MSRHANKTDPSIQALVILLPILKPHIHNLSLALSLPIRSNTINPLIEEFLVLISLTTIPPAHRLLLPLPLPINNLLFTLTFPITAWSIRIIYCPCPITFLPIRDTIDGFPLAFLDM